ncbi:MAG: cell division protein FtsQ/DivIB [Micromonosporaceae bacterium]
MSASTEGSDGPRGWRLVQAGGAAVSAASRGYARRLSRGWNRSRWLVIALVLVVSGAGTWLLYGTSLCSVAQVRVEGVRVLSAGQVRQAADVRLGAPLARLDTDAIDDRVSRLAPARRVTVERDWPDAVVVRVLERTPVAAVPARNGFAIVDGAGVVFDSAPQRPGDLPLVELKNPSPNNALTRDTLRVLDSLTEPLRAALVKLAAPSLTRIRLHLTEGRVVIWGDAEQSRKKAEVATILIRRSAKVIDVSAPDVVTTR